KYTNMKKLSLLFFLFTGITFSALAQSEISNFTVTGSGLATTLSEDYESFGINPSNLGWDNTKKLHFGLLEGGYSIYSDEFTKKQFSNNFLLSFHDSKLSASTTTKADAALEMANKGYAINVDEALLGVAVQLPGIGGFGFTARARGSDYMHLNGTGADIVYNGSSASYFSTASTNPQSLSTLFDGSKMYSDVYMEYNLSYGRRWYQNDDIKIYGGVGVKYIQSFGILDIESKGGTLTAFTAFSPRFNANYGAVSPSSDSSGTLKPIGSGFGFDIGGSIIIKEKMKIGIAVDDIGSVTYTGNVYKANNTNLLSTTKLAGLQYLANYKDINDLIGGDGVFKLQGLKTTSISLPTNLRLGYSYDVLKNLVVGADVYLPLADVPGNLLSPEIGVGGQVKLFNLIKLSTGVNAGGNSAFNIPLGITFVPHNGSYEFGVATRDILYLASNSNPNAS